MANLIKLNKDQVINSYPKLECYFNPDFIYVPVLLGNKILVNQDDYVLKGQNLTDNFCSPVSGKIVGVKKMVDCDTNIIDCIVVKNDYKEKRYKKISTKKNISLYSIENANLNLKNSGINFGFDIAELENLNTLLINTLETEPHIYTECLVMYENVGEILETIDSLLEIYNINQGILAIKDSAHELVNKVMNHLGMFPKIKIKLIPDVYPIHHDKLLLSHLNIKENIKVLKASILPQIYNSLKKNIRPDSKVITFSGNVLSNTQVFEVKLGTSIKNIIDEKLKLVDQDYLCLVNGLLSRRIVNPENLIVTEDLSSIILVKNELKEERNCLNCGSCVEICPYKVNPRLVMDSYNKSKKYKTNIENCSGCGLCEHVCPANIKLTKYLQRGIKDEK